MSFDPSPFLRNTRIFHDLVTQLKGHFLCSAFPTSHAKWVILLLLVFIQHTLVTLHCNLFLYAYSHNNVTCSAKRIISNLSLNTQCPIPSRLSIIAYRTVSVVKLMNVSNKLLFNTYLTCSVPGSAQVTGIWQRTALIKITAITSTGGM